MLEHMLPTYMLETYAEAYAGNVSVEKYAENMVETYILEGYMLTTYIYRVHRLPT